MSRHISCACPEYDELSRRRFLQATAGGAAALTLANWIPRIAVAKDYRSGLRDVSVSIFLRGACDMMTMVAPFSDANYQAGRATLKVLPFDDTVGPVNQRGIQIANATVPNPAGSAAPTTTFALAPALAPLAGPPGTFGTPYNDGKLLIVHATGSMNSSRSHFDAQRYMETGKPGDNTLFTGWIGRHLASVNPPMNSNGFLRGLGFADGLQRALIGAPLTLPIPDPVNYTLSGNSATLAARKQALIEMYGNAPEPVQSAAENTFATIDLLGTITLLNQIRAGTYVPSGGAVYPTTTGTGGSNGTVRSLATALRSTAALIKANIGLEAVAIDMGGWDTHTNQNPFSGTITMYPYIDGLAKSLAAFYTDLNGAGSPGYILTVMSEFGRRLVENGEPGLQGTDHGHGTAMFVMGPAVNGGRVLTQWPGLASNQLFQGLDLQVTIDYRDILAEIVQERLGNSDLASVFPGFTPTDRGVLA